jgi:GTP pyrophosphokinase
MLGENVPTTTHEAVIRLNDITEKVQSYNPTADIDVIRRAYVFSAKVHQGQVRLSGEPYLTHPLHVAWILTEFNMDAFTIATGLLHDTVEDTLTTLESIQEIFGEEIATLVDGVTKIGKISFHSYQERQAENFRKMVLAMAKDIRVILIKLADRLHNMRTLEFLPADKRELIAQETHDIYAPIANRLGIGWLKNELENLSFYTLKPEVYHQLSEKLEGKRTELDRYAQDVIDIIQKQLKSAGIDADLQSRIKHIYGIYKKMLDQEIDFEEVYDIVAFRVIVGNIKDCYGSLGIIHSLWKPVPGRFKDYIAMPKPNMYQSLHTTVIGPKGERIEVQIRTAEMHKIAESGIAAHWTYKEGGAAFKSDDKKSYDWLQRLIESQNNLKDPGEFLKSVKMDLFLEEVYVFTPKGEVKAFPRGATPLDFAYSIHTDVGNTCVGAKVNGKLVPLKYELKNGDAIEILTNKNQNPSSDWIRYVVTSRAKQKIRHWIVNEQRERSLALGKEILEKEFKKYGLNFQKLMNSQQLKNAADELKTKNIEDLIIKVANARITTNQVLEHFVPPEKLHKHLKPKEPDEIETKKPKKKKGTTGILVKGVSDMMFRYAKCCNPVPGDDIVGYISRGRGVIVHTTDCPNVEKFEMERVVEVSWEVPRKETDKDLYNSKIIVVCSDKRGVLAKIASAISEAEANISEAKITKRSDQRSVCEFFLEIRNLDHLKRVMKSVEKEPDVYSVDRVM